MTRFGFSREPAVWVGAITSLLLVAADFGFHLTGSQAEHLLAAVPVLMALFIRQTVTPNGSVPAPATPVVDGPAQPADLVGMFVQQVASERKVIDDATTRLADLAKAASAAAAASTPPPAAPAPVADPVADPAG